MNKLEAIQKMLGAKTRCLAHDVAILQIPNEVKEAIRLCKSGFDFSLEGMPQALDWEKLKSAEAQSSEEIFTGADGKRYPCWLPGDESLGDDWLLSHQYYPYYFRLYHQLGKEMINPSLLEFGVRSGYSGVVFSKAVPGAKTYVGVDPNLYVAQGLESAAATYRQLQKEGNLLQYFLIEGFSSSEAVQKTLSFSAPFDFIHVDGEHTLQGKILDLRIARNLVSENGYVLVDDFEHHGFIFDSVKVACKLGWFSKFSFVPTKRGLGVLKV
jgi:hypothetical protein